MRVLVFYLILLCDFKRSKKRKKKPYEADQNWRYLIKSFASSFKRR